MILHYARDGKPIDLHTFARLLANEEYKRVAEATVGPYWVSTVWLGIDHGFGRQAAPVIFETMVFATVDDDPYSLNLACWRWSTEEQAKTGHEEIVLLVRATTQEEPPHESVSDVRPGDERA